MSGRVSQRASGIAFGLAAALIWGGFPVMTRLGVAYSSLDMYDVTFLRFAVSGLLLLPILLHGGFGDLGLKPVALMVVGIGAPYMLVVSHGLALAPVGVFAVLTPSTMILFSVLLGVWWLKASLSTRELIGIVAILIGASLAGYEDLRNASSGTALALFVFGGLLWAIYTVSTKVYAVGSLRATAIVSVVSAVIYSPPYFLAKGATILDAPATELLTQAIYQGVFVSILALFFYSKSVSLLGPALGASFAALVPVLAVIEAWVLLGEHPAMLSLAGLAIVTVGMAFNIVWRRK